MIISTHDLCRRVRIGNYTGQTRKWKKYDLEQIQQFMRCYRYFLLIVHSLSLSFSQLICFICMHEWYNNEPKCVKKEVFFFIIPSRNLLWRWFSIVAVRACVRMCDCVWISAFYTTLEDNPRMHVCETLYIL